MWSRLAIVLIVSVAVGYCDHDWQHAWEQGKQYKYHIQSHTLTTVGNANQPKSNQKASGVVMRGSLVVQAQTPETLLANVPKLQYASVNLQDLQQHEEFGEYSQQQKHRDIPMSGKSFWIKVKHGVIRDILVEKNVPIWEVNILKSIMSTLQVDTQGENIIQSQHNQAPDNEQQPFASFKVMEDSVGGNCEVYYDIAPLAEDILVNNEMVPLPELDENNNFIEIRKVKSYDKCKQQASYHFRQPNSAVSWQSDSTTKKQVHKYVSHDSTNYMVISGDLKRFTIQSSVTTDNIFVKPDQQDAIGNVRSRMNVTLVEKQSISNPLPNTDHIVSTGNLVYMYNDPFSEDTEISPREPSVAQNSQSSESSSSSSSSSSSEENHRKSVRSALSNDQQDSVRSGSSSSSSSSSGSSSEENLPHDPSKQSYYQNRPRLNEAPHNPLLPLFVGINGKNIHTSDKIDIVQLAANVVVQITEELQDPNVDRVREMLEKFTILQNLLRTMNTNQVAEVEKRATNPNKSLPTDVMKNIQNTFHQVIAQTGTGPALEIIARNLKDKKLEGWKAAMVISRIPKTARTPTSEYVREFFKIITSPEVRNQEHVKVAGPLAFAELLRNVLTNKRSYPTDSFGKIVSPDNVEKYLSHFENQLKQVIQEKNNPQILTYITAIGLTGHPGSIIIFEPYLEGWSPVSEFQRLTMVISLSSLSEKYVDLSRLIFYNIYASTKESDRIRVAAFHNLIKTDPPLSLFIRLAQATNTDKSAQLNSAVRTTINSLARLKLYRSRHVALKARVARRFLNPKAPLVASKGYYADSINTNDFIRQYYVETIGSENILPNSVHYGAETAYDHLGNFELAVAVSSVKQLFQSYWENKLGENLKKTLADKIAGALNMKLQDVKELEGYLKIATAYETHFYPFGQDQWNKLINNAKDVAQKHQFDVNHLQCQNMIISYPTESGLPFIYTVHKPMLHKLHARNTGENNNHDITAKGVLNILFAHRIQNRFGFTTPFEHQQYIAGVDRDITVKLPIEFKAMLQHGKNQFNLELKSSQPRSQNSQQKLMRISIVPFVTQHNILDLQPLSHDRNMQIALGNSAGARPELSQRTASFGEGVFNVMAESDKEVAETPNFNYLLNMIKSPNVNDVHYRKVNVYVDNDAANKGWRFNVAHDESSTNNAANQQHESQRLQVFTVIDPQIVINSDTRRKQFLTMISHNKEPTNNHVLDVDVEYPTAQNQQGRTVVTVAWACNKVNPKYKILFYSSDQSARNESIHYEVLGAGEVQLSPITPLNYENMMDEKQQDNFEFEIQFENYHKTNNKGKVYIIGNTTQTNELRNIIKNSEPFKKCQKDSTQGNKGSEACQKAAQLATMKDRLNILMHVEDKDKNDTLLNAIIDWMRRLFGGKVERVQPSTQNNRNTIDMEIKTSPYRDQADVFISNSEINVTLSLFGLSTESSSEMTQTMNLAQLASQTLSQSSSEYLSALAIKWDKVTKKLIDFMKSLLPDAVKLLEDLAIKLFEQIIENISPSSSPTILSWVMLPGLSPLLSLEKQIDLISQQSQIEATCSIDKNQVVTFDRKTYTYKPIYSKNAWKIAVTHILSHRSDNSRTKSYVPKRLSFGILVGDNEDGSKRVRFLFYVNFVELWKSNNALNVLIDGKTVREYKKEDEQDQGIYQYLQNGEVLVEIIELPDKSIKIFSEKFGVKGVYDGERILLQLADSYRNAIRGLCGTYSSQTIDDFTSPRDCVVRNPEEFIAMYTVTEDGQGYTVKNKDEQYQCVKQSPRPRYIINDIDAGRSKIASNFGYHADRLSSSRKNKQNRHRNQNDRMSSRRQTPLIYRTKIVEDDNEICFSVRPVPLCDENSWPTDTQKKRILFYCTPMDEAAQQLRDRIEQGANPDLSHKPVSTTEMYEVPLACESAGSA